MEKIIIPLSRWQPDYPAYGGKFARQARNVIPTESGYKPFPSAAPNGTVLPSKAFGAYSYQDVSDTTITLAGTEGGMYYRASVGAFVAAVTGLHGSRGYSFARYGSNIFFTNGVDTPRYSPTVAAPSFAELTGAPVADCAAVVGNFLMLGGLASQPEAVQWSAIDNPLSWPVPGSNEAVNVQSDLQIFPDAGRVMAIAAGMSGYDGLAFCEKGIFHLQYVGPPYIFQVSPVDKTRGAAARKSVVQAENIVYFLAEDGLHATDGARVWSIGAGKIERWWQEFADFSRREEIQGVYDPVNDFVAWAFPSINCAVGVFDHLLIYSISQDAFSLAETPTELLYLDTGRGLTLEDLDVMGSLDSLPYSLDAKVLMPVVRQLSAFTPSHAPVVFNGLSMEATIETGEIGGNRMMVEAARPLIDGSPARVSIAHRAYQEEGTLETPCSAPSRLDGLQYTHFSDRYIRAVLDFGAGMNWRNAVGVEIYFEKEGGL